MNEPGHPLNELITIVHQQVDRFPPRSAQHTLQVNRLNALHVALAIDNGEPTTYEMLKQAELPLRSLIAKSEKALTKLKPGSWQVQRMMATVAVLRPILAQLLKRLDNEKGNQP
jgi:uncharacterized protein involved in exopolysaccharide biosynthesis